MRPYPPCPIPEGDLPLILLGDVGLRPLGKTLAQMPLSPRLARWIEAEWDDISDEAQSSLMANPSITPGLLERGVERAERGDDVHAEWVSRNPSIRGALAERMIAACPKWMCGNPALDEEQQEQLMAWAKTFGIWEKTACLERLANRDGLAPSVVSAIASMEGLPRLALCRSGGLDPDLEVDLMRQARDAAAAVRLKRFSAGALHRGAEMGLLMPEAAQHAPLSAETQMLVLGGRPPFGLMGLWRNIAHNPHLAPEGEGVLLEVTQLHSALACRERVGEATERVLLAKGDWRAREELAMNHWTSGPTLARLSADPEDAVARAACESPWFTDPGAQLEAARSRDVERPMMLTHNPSVRGLGVLSALARSRSSRVRRGAACHPMLVFPALQRKLAAEESSGVGRCCRTNPTVAKGLRPSPFAHARGGEDDEDPHFPAARQAGRAPAEILGGVSK